VTSDLFVINSPKEPSWISTASDAASTWLWEHGDIIPLMLSEALLAAVIVAVFVWWESRQAQRNDAVAIERIEGEDSQSQPGRRLNPNW
jgi:hypothetical protein